MIKESQNFEKTVDAQPFRVALLFRFSLFVLLLALAGVSGAQEFTNTASQAQIAAPAPTAGQVDLIQKLLNRVEQLEKNGAEQIEQGKALQKAHEESEQRLQGQVKELQGKIESLEAGRVLPEISVVADEEPTVHELDQKLRIMDRKNELQTEAAEARSKEVPRLTIGQNGLTFSSADTNFVVKLKGQLQLDSRTYFNDNKLSEGNDGFVLRRVRPILEGTVYRDFDYQFVPDFGGSSVQIFDAWMNYRYRPELQLRLGKFKGPVGLENLQSDSYLPFNERSLVSDLVPTRSIGLQLGGDIGDGTVSYAAGLFNGAGDGRNPNTSDFNDNKEFAGRLFFQPFEKTSLTALQGFGFGLGGSYSQVSSNATGLPGTTGGTLPGYQTAGQQQFFAYNPIVGTVVADGPHYRLSPQAYYYHGPFGVLSEYAISHQGLLNSFTARRAEVDNTAWQVSGQWVLTGENASFSGIVPKKPFDLRAGQWGAWQLVGRYGQLNIDDAAFPSFANDSTSASGATGWSVGINWWLNKNVRVLTSYSRTMFDGGGSSDPLLPGTLVPPATVTHQDENVLFTRLQIAF